MARSVLARTSPTALISILVFSSSRRSCLHAFHLSQPKTRALGAASPRGSTFSIHKSSLSFSAISSSSTIMAATPKRVLVPIGDGSEEIETTCITDTLTRFGADVRIASVMNSESLVCTMSRGIKVIADMSIDDAAKEEWDLVALPGGMPGAEHLRDSDALIQLLEKQKKEGKLYGAVCAAPAVVFASKGLFPSTQSGIATCYPAPQFREKLNEPVDDLVVVTENMVTSQGPGTSLQFALSLGEQLYGKEKRDEIAKAMLVD